MSYPLSPGEVHTDEVTSRGHLDDVSFTRVRGWAWDSARPGERIVLIVCVGDRVLARIFADQSREDLKEAGIGDGRHGFEFQLIPPLLSDVDHMIAVRKEYDGEHLAGSPTLLKGMSILSSEEKADIVSRLSNACEDGELDVRLNFVAEQLETLRQRRSALRSPLRAGRAAALMTGPACRRALVIDDTAPRLANDAGSNAILSHVRSLQRLGFAVSFAPSDLAPASVFEDAETGVDCWRSPELSSIEEGLRRRTGHFDIVYLHRVSNASRYITLVREHQPRARLIFSVADLHHLRLARQAEIEERAELARFALHVRAEELSAAARSDAVITHSSAEASLLHKALPRTAVYVVPWAVPLRPTSQPFARRRGMAFIAHYGHKPNVDAAQWLVTEVLPAIERSGSSIPCILAGTAMPDHLRKIQRSNVEIVGAVDDLATVFDRVRLTVAPLAFGAGLKGKVLDSLAAGVPCVCTPTAAEGLHLPAPLNEQISTSVEDFADSILRLHDDPALNAACRAVGLAFIEAFASEENVEGLLREALGDRC